MSNLSRHAQLVHDIFEEVAKGNGAPFWEACRDDIVWRTIGESSWSGEFVGKQTIIDEIFRPLNCALVERATIPTRVIDGGNVIVVQARGRNLTQDGRRYDNDYAFVIHFVDGKIARFEEYCDTDLMTRVLPNRHAAKLDLQPAIRTTAIEKNPRNREEAQCARADSQTSKSSGSSSRRTPA